MREQATQRLLKPASFGTFLAGARKVHSPPYQKVYFFAAPPYKEVCERSATSIGVIIGFPNRLTNRWHLTRKA